jgi:1,4-alpha-glucan branching enzyme
MRRSGLVVASVVLVVLFTGCSYFLPRRHALGPAVDGDQVVFRYYAPSARRVQVAGDWPGNNWARGDGRAGEANIGLMDDGDGDGVWERAIALPPGRHRYLFLVDENTWHTDPANPEEIEGGPARLCSFVLVRRNGDKLELR